MTTRPQARPRHRLSAERAQKLRRWSIGRLIWWDFVWLVLTLTGLGWILWRVAEGR